jgi:hypothetical protein
MIAKDDGRNRRRQRTCCARGYRDAKFFWDEDRKQLWNRVG